MNENFAVITKKFPPKQMNGETGKYTLYRFEAEVDYGTKKKPVIFNAFDAVGDMANRLNIDDKIKIKWWAESKHRNEKDHYSLNKVSWIEKI